MQSVYPAIISFNKKQGLDIVFPDIPECKATGDNIDNALKHAEDALLYYYSNCIEDLPKPSKISSISVPSNSFLGLIELKNNG